MPTGNSIQVMKADIYKLIKQPTPTTPHQKRNKNFMHELVTTCMLGWRSHRHRVWKKNSSPRACCIYSTAIKLKNWSISDKDLPEPLKAGRGPVISADLSLVVEMLSWVLYWSFWHVQCKWSRHLSYKFRSLCTYDMVECRFYPPVRRWYLNVIPLILAMILLYVILSRWSTIRCILHWSSVSDVGEWEIYLYQCHRDVTSNAVPSNWEC